MADKRPDSGQMRKRPRTERPPGSDLETCTACSIIHASSSLTLTAADEAPGFLPFDALELEADDDTWIASVPSRCGVRMTARSKSLLPTAFFPIKRPTRAETPLKTRLRSRDSRCGSTCTDFTINSVIKRARHSAQSSALLARAKVYTVGLQLSGRFIRRSDSLEFIENASERTATFRSSLFSH
jgi:hypothetical protein